MSVRTLGDFFLAFRAIRLHSQDVRSSFEDRLAFLFYNLQCLRAPLIPLVPTSASTSLPDVNGLEAVFEKLRDLVQGAKRSGAFLNVWDVAGLGRNELRNAAVLAWLFNPQGSHGRNAAFLNECLRSLRDKTPRTFNLPIPIEACEIATELCPLGDQASRVDIVIDGKNFSAFIEVKIDAPEGKLQTERYLRAHPQSLDS